MPETAVETPDAPDAEQAKPFSIREVFGLPDKQADGAQNGDDAQAGDGTGDDAPAGKTEAEVKTENEPPPGKEGADDLVEIEVSEGVKEKVPAAVAAQMSKLRGDYKSLEAEFTRRNQAAAEAKRAEAETNPAKADTNAGKDETDDKAYAESLAKCDQRLMDALVKEDGRGATETILKLARVAAEDVIEEAIQKRLAPLEKFVIDMLGEKHTERVASEFTAEICQELGIDPLDAIEVAKEAKSLAAARGMPAPKREEFVFAIAKLTAAKASNGNTGPPKTVAVAPHRRTPPSPNLAGAAGTPVLPASHASALMRGPAASPRLDSSDDL